MTGRGIEAALANRPLRIALTGAHTFLGSQLIQRLERDPRCAHILVLDVRPSEVSGLKSRFARLDLTNPRSDERAATLLIDNEIDVLCHLAFLSKPSHASSWAHELEAIGSLYVMNAAAASRVAKVVLGSTAMVYGAYPDNPNFLTEEHPLRGQPASRWVGDKVAAERELIRLARDCPDKVTTALRFGMTLGPSGRSYHSRVFRRQFLPRLMGYDPLMQFLHEEDAVDALIKAVMEDHPGAYNVVGDGVVLYSNVLAIGHRLGVPIPHALAYPAASALWNLQVADTPGKFLNYFRYSWLADHTKMRTVMGFIPKHSSRDTVASFYANTAPRGAL